MLNTKASKKLFTVSRKHSTFVSYVKGSNSSYLFMQLYVGIVNAREKCAAPMTRIKKCFCKNVLSPFTIVNIVMNAPRYDPTCDLLLLLS